MWSILIHVQCHFRSCRDRLCRVLRINHHHDSIEQVHRRSGAGMNDRSRKEPGRPCNRSSVDGFHSSLLRAKAAAHQSRSMSSGCRWVEQKCCFLGDEEGGQGTLRPEELVGGAGCHLRRQGDVSAGSDEKAVGLYQGRTCIVNTHVFNVLEFWGIGIGCSKEPVSFTRGSLFLPSSCQFDWMSGGVRSCVFGWP